MKQPLAVPLVAGLRLYSSAKVAGAASIEAGTFMNVTVAAELFDPSPAAAGGCDPVGCVGDLTRVSQVASCMYPRAVQTRRRQTSIAPTARPVVVRVRHIGHAV